MTRDQAQIFSLLKKDNKKARQTGKAYLTDTAPLEAFCGKIPTEAAKEFIKSYPALKSDMKADFEALCWLLYFRCASLTPIDVHRDPKNPQNDFINVPDTPQNKEFWALLTAILSHLNRLNSEFVEIAQNRVVSNFAKTLAIGYEPNFIANTATSIVKSKQRKFDIQYTIQNYFLNDERTEAITPSISALKLFYCLLLAFNTNHSQSLDIPLREYASLVKGKPPEEISASVLKELRAQVVKDLDFLKYTNFDYQEKIGGKWTHCGTFSWNGGTALIDHGHILWNWNTDFIPELERLAPTIYNKGIFTARLNSDEFFFYDVIDKNYRFNEDKPSRLNKIKITQFLDACVRIPKYKDVKKSDYKKQIITPFHRIMDELKNIEVIICNQDGEPRTSPDEWQGYEEFAEGYVIVDYSDYPVNTARIEKKRAYAEENREEKKQKKKS